VSISIPAFLFCLGFAVFLGCLFAWVYNYRNLHKEPTGNPQRVTDTIGVPVDFAADAGQEGTAIKRMEQEKTCYETGTVNKEMFIKKLLAIFRGHLEKEERKILSICYWEFKDEGFALKLYNSRCRMVEGLSVPLGSNRYFSKKEFNWNGMDDIPADIYHTEELVANSMAGALVSGNGKRYGYITIDSTDLNVFDDEICMELRELATLTEEALRTLDNNQKLDQQNILFNEMLKNILDLFHSTSKGNLLYNLSQVLQDNFRFNRLTIIIPHEHEEDTWQIAEVIGEQKEELKGESFNVHVKCLLYEILVGKVSVINEKNISTDPYQRRFFENEPENLELRSLFAVRPPVQYNSYPLIIVLESKNEKAVSITDQIMLTSIAASAALKLSDIQGKDNSKQEKENILAAVDANGFGEIMRHYEKEIDNLKNSTDGLGIILLKCIPSDKSNRVAVFDKFLTIMKNFKKQWNVQHLAMLGRGEFVLSMKGEMKEQGPVFELFSGQIINLTKGMLDSEDFLSVKSHPIWLTKDKLKDVEKRLGQSGKTLFMVSLASKFQEMSEAGE